MPGEMVTLLLGVQGGDEEAFACLHAVTNPVILRYLRVVSDADPAPLALATWATLADRMPALVADDDDDWLELAIGTARETAVASGAMVSDAAPSGGASSTDPVAEGVAALRACGPAVGEVLAMGMVAGLGRDSIARITGREPTEVLAMVHEGQRLLTVPFEGLAATMQVPGTPDEVSDLPAVLPLFTAQAHSPLPAVATAERSPESRKVAALATGAVASGALAAAAVGAGAAASAAPASEASVVDLFAWDAPAQSTTRAAMRRTTQVEGSTRLAKVGAGGAAWAIAIAGVGTAAAISGVIPAALHNLFGDQNNGVVTAHGPARPGVPSTGGGPQPTPRPSTGPTQPTQPQVPVPPVTQPTPDGAGLVIPATAQGSDSGTPLVVVPAVFNPSPPTTPTTPTTPNRPPSPPPVTTPQPTGGTGSVTGAGHAFGKDHAKHSTGLAKGRAKAVAAAAKAQAAAARAKAKAAAAKARAAAKAAAKARAAAKAADAKAAAAIAKAAKAKA